MIGHVGNKTLNYPLLGYIRQNVRGRAVLGRFRRAYLVKFRHVLIYESWAASGAAVVMAAGAVAGVAIWVTIHT